MENEVDKSICPECKKAMKPLTYPGKDEFYCADCHVSVPMFKK